MKFSRSQLITISGFILLFLLLYFGCSTTPKKQQLIEKSRAAQQESTSALVLIREAKDLLTKDKLDLIRMYEHELEIATVEQKISVLKKLSGNWYAEGFEAIAGHFAEQVAELDETAESWGIAGSTYMLGAKQTTGDKQKSFAVERAIKCFENAYSIDPENQEYKVNKAILLTENPPADNPMKGIQELLQLNTDFPDNISVLNQLGRFGIQTGQFEKAIGRFKKVLILDSENETAICLLADAYGQLGQIENAELYSAKCNSIKLLKENI